MSPPGGNNLRPWLRLTGTACRLSDWLINCCWPLPSQWFSVLSPTGHELIAMETCLQSHSLAMGVSMVLLFWLPVDMSQYFSRPKWIHIACKQNPSSLTMVLGSTQPLAEMSTRNHPGCKGWLTTSPPSVSRLSRKMWEPRRLTILWASVACYRDSFTFLQASFVRSVVPCSLTCHHIMVSPANHSFCNMIMVVKLIGPVYIFWLSHGFLPYISFRSFCPVDF
jgi:hypothetical protein